MSESVGVFLGVTGVLGGGCAFLTGQALANTWRPAWLVLPYGALLAAGARFLSFALFAAPLLSAPAFLATLALLLAVARAAYRLTLARRMVTQYPWLYERAGPFDWREIDPRG